MNQYIMSGDGTINIFTNGKVYCICPDIDGYTFILKLVKENLQDVDFEYKLKKLIESPIHQYVDSFTYGKVEVDVKAGKVTYDKVEFPDRGLCERIIRLMKEGQDFQYLVKFLDNMCKNPSFRSAMELFKFIQKEGFPITERGTILGYKGVRQDYYDRHSGTIHNGIGATIRVPRESVCDDSTSGCAPGLHVGSHNYAVNWAADGRVLLVEVNPKDVVSVPSCEVDKLRCCEYRVVAEHTGNNVLKGEVYDSNTGTRIPPSDYLPQFEQAHQWDEGHTYGAFDVDDLYNDEYDNTWYENDDNDWYYDNVPHCSG